MGHPEVENKTPLAFEPWFTADEDGASVIAPIVKGTFSLGTTGRLLVAEQQMPVNMTGEHWGDPQSSSYKYEPEGVILKPTTDVVLIGHAYPSRNQSAEVDVTLKIGPVEKSIKVIGNRFWVKRAGISMTPPEPFERIQLVYDNAFGGWDRSHHDPQKHSCELRNPVGTGFRSRDGVFEEGIRLPNLEDPRDRIRQYGDVPTPVGLGFTSPNWMPRASLAGSFDVKWMQERMPLLPRNFDRRFFNAASPGLIMPGYLRGNEQVTIDNAAPNGRISFRLPGVPSPACQVQLRARRAAEIDMRLDTVVINTDDNLLLLFWRGTFALRNGPQDVLAVQARMGTVEQ
jgi:hypothetical protein